MGCYYYYLCVALLLFCEVHVQGVRTTDHYFSEEETIACHHDSLTADQLVTGVHAGRTKRLTSEHESFRITEFYQNHGWTTEGTNQVMDVISNQVLPYLESSLNVLRESIPLQLDGSCDVDNPSMCLDATIPIEHLKGCDPSSSGVIDTDYILYVTGLDCSGSVIGYAAACQMEDVLDRPIAGNINLCPNYVNGGVSDEELRGLIIHEIIHALGFSRGLYPFFRDEEGNPRTERDPINNLPPIVDNRYAWSNTTARDIVITDWDTRNGETSHAVTILVTPNVVEEAKRHYNCPAMEGLELENQGGSGTALSHWEQRLVQNEVMAGVSVFGSGPVSRLTFALLQDTGWYRVNYDVADEFYWGRNAGCSFATGSCGGYIKEKQSNLQQIFPFCNHLIMDNSISTSGCDYARSAVSYCNLSPFPDPLPSEYQYFNSGDNFNSSSQDVSGVGGLIEVYDYCPFQRPFSDGPCSDQGNAPTGINTAAQTYGTGSRCFEHGQRWTARTGGFIYTPNTLMSGCYKYICSPTHGVLVDVLGNLYQCSCEGEILDIGFSTDDTIYSGSIICPSCSQICYDTPDDCPSPEPDSCFGDSTTASVVCPPLNDPQNGQVSYSITTGSEARYACDGGFVLSGSEVRVCGEDGQWSGTEPICEVQPTVKMSFINDSPRISGSNVEIDFTTSDPLDSHRCFVRDINRMRTFSDCSSRSVEFNDLDPGRYVFVARASVSRARIRRIFWIGEEYCRVHAINDGITVSEGNVTVEYAGNQEYEGFQCKLDGDRFSSCDRPLILQTSDLEPGKHRIRIRPANCAEDAERRALRFSFTIN